MTAVLLTALGAAPLLAVLVLVLCAPAADHRAEPQNRPAPAVPPRTPSGIYTPRSARDAER